MLYLIVAYSNFIICLEVHVHVNIICLCYVNCTSKRNMQVTKITKLTYKSTDHAA